MPRSLIYPMVGILPPSAEEGSMKRFAAKMRKLVGEAKGMRPLLCDGNPLTCTVALVGANPRTTTPFWKFWSDARGMDRRRWIEAYKLQHGGKFNRSRAAIERFVPQVAARVIELNAHAAAAKRLVNLERSLRTTEVLAFVLEAVRPKVIVCAGKVAIRAVRSMSLPWDPAMLEAKAYIYWGRKYEMALAAKVNQLL